MRSYQAFGSVSRVSRNFIKEVHDEQPRSDLSPPPFPAVICTVASQSQGIHKKTTADWNLECLGGKGIKKLDLDPELSPNDGLRAGWDLRHSSVTRKRRYNSSVVKWTGKGNQYVSTNRQ